MAGQRILWKNLARRRSLLKEYEARQYSIKILGVHFRLMDEPDEGGLRLLENMATAIRERINGRLFTDFWKQVELEGRRLDFRVFRRSGAIMINGHLAMQVIQGLIKLSEEDVIPPIAFEDVRPEHVESIRWRKMLGEDYIKVELIWIRIPEGSYPAGGRIIMSSGRERTAAWRITCGGRCLLLIFRNWVNPIHRSRLMMDAAALAAAAKNHSKHYPYISAAIICTGNEGKTITAIEEYSYKTLRKFMWKPLAQQHLMNPNWSSISCDMPVKAPVYVYPEAPYTSPKCRWITRETPIPIEEAYSQTEEISQAKLRQILNYILNLLGIHNDMMDRLRREALKQGGQTLWKTLTEKIIRETEGTEKTIKTLKAMKKAFIFLELLKNRGKPKGKNQKTIKSLKTSRSYIPMYKCGGSGEKGGNQASPSLDAVKRSEASAGFSAAATPPPKPPPEMDQMRLIECRVFFRGFVIGECWARPPPLKAAVKWCRKNLKGYFQPRKKYAYVVVEDELGLLGRFWLPLHASRRFRGVEDFLEFLRHIESAFWSSPIPTPADRAMPFSRPLVRLMILTRLYRAISRLRRRNAAEPLQAFIRRLVEAELERLLEAVHTPKKDRYLNLMLLEEVVEWLDEEKPGLNHMLICRRYRGLPEEEVLECLPEEERGSGWIAPEMPYIDAEAPPSIRMIPPYLRWEAWMIYSGVVAERLLHGSRAS